jgi:hypothetical protein
VRSILYALERRIPAIGTAQVACHEVLAVVNKQEAASRTRTPPAPGATPHRAALDFARWALASLDVCQIKSQPFSRSKPHARSDGEQALAEDGPHRGRSALDHLQGLAHGGVATFGVFQHRLASGSPQGQHAQRWLRVQLRA